MSERLSETISNGLYKEKTLDRNDCECYGGCLVSILKAKETYINVVTIIA